MFNWRNKLDKDTDPLSEASDLTNPVDEPVDDEGTQDEAEEPYAVRSNPRAPRGFHAAKGLDQEFVIVGEAGMYVGTIVDVCADLEAGSYAGESLIREVWRRVEDPRGVLSPWYEQLITNVGWPIPGDKTQWPDYMGNVRVGLYTRTMIDATDNERRLAESGNGLRCLAWATFMIDGAA